MNNKRSTFHRFQGILSLILLAVIMAACAPKAPTVQDAGGGAPRQSSTTGDSAPVEAHANEESARASSDAAEPNFAGSDSTGGGGASDAIEAGKSGEGAAAPSVAGSESEGIAADSSGVAVAPPPASDSSDSRNEPPPYVPPDVQLQPLQAGVVDDNADFRQYLQYRIDFHSFLDLNVDDLDISERYIIRVLGSSSRPVLGADVSIYDGQSLITTLHTPATGLVYFFPNAYPSTQGASQFDVIVEKDQTSEEFTIQRGQNDNFWDVTLGVGATQAPVQLDVLFLIDSTGSMGDEIDELKNNILSISAQVAALPSRPDVRFGMVTYRDRGDQYVTQNYDFTRDVQAFQGVLMNLRAAGGGDTPEAMNEGLSEAIYGMNWRGGETVSLVFLVADAPPQLIYPQDVSYADSVLDAVQAGIKIDPIASRLCRREDGCSGEDRAYQEQAEYIFRQMAQFTGGKFIFLAYEDTPTSSGTPGTDSHVTEDQYSVQDLDSLVVRLIQEEMAALEGGQQ